MKSLAAILVESHRPLVVDHVELPVLAVGQVVVRILYTTICGAQLNEIDAAKGPDKFLPHLLGHEASAEVMEVGPGVTAVSRDDRVVLHWRPALGIQSRNPVYSWQGRALNAGWVTTFQEYAVVSENRCTPLRSSLFSARLAPLLGCAATTAWGAVCNDAKVKVGDAVLVIGAGGVGLQIIQFAAMAGAHPIVALDLVPEKLAAALHYGADRTAFPGGWISDGPIFDKVFDTTGSSEMIAGAYKVTAPDGICVLVGVPHEPVAIDTLPLHFGKVLTGSHGGNCKPHRDIPRIVRLIQSGRLTFDGLITHEFALADINSAIDLMRTGKAGRIVLNCR